MKEERSERVAEMSIGMYQELCKHFETFESYEAMMFSKMSFKVRDGEKVAVTYSLDEMNNYESKFVEPFAKNLNDQFIFERHTKIYRTEFFDGKTKSVASGWFIPASFWSYYWNRWQTGKKKMQAEQEQAERIDKALEAA